MYKCLKFAASFAVLVFAASPAAAMPPEDVKSLAEIVRAILPNSGWKMSVKDDTVILEREEKIGWYNGLQLPDLKSEEELRAYVKPSVRFDKLTISLRLGKRLDARAFKAAVENNEAAWDRAARDQGENEKEFMPKDGFWAKHPEYRYQELPVIDTGTKSIYMTCLPSGAILRPTKAERNPNGGRALNFWDKAIGQECQGIIDALGKKFSTY